MKIERRTATVTLNFGNYKAELADLQERMLAEFRKEEAAGPRRAGSKSKAAEMAREYDAKLAEGEAAGTTVTLHEISNVEWQELTDAHPPRDGDDRDKRAGWNTKTLPLALLKASLGETDLDLDALSPAHMTKLKDAAWNLHNADDALPKESMVSLLKQYREAASKLERDSE